MRFRGHLAAAETLLLVSLAILQPAMLNSLSADESAETQRVKLRTSRLELTVVDNGAYPPVHRAGYNGVSELSIEGDSHNLFVPTYAGLNFEHIFSGDAQSYGWSIFEPRRAPMSLKRVAPNRVELHQQRTEHWPLETTLVYEAVEPNSIDLTVSCIPRADAWKKHGYIGIFFASYIQAPEDKGISFIGRPRESGDTEARWIHHHSPKHGTLASHPPKESRWEPTYDEGFRLTLVSGLSRFEYDYPFYYGRSRDKVAIFMFERPRDGAEVRIAQSPTGGGPRNPAWDLLLLKRGYRINEAFQFRIRLVYTDFRGREAVIQAYEAWSNEKVTRPRK